ncbi:alpha/beta fold hydrolase [uncultured Jatrophihabitans sp.]|uniref:alpha/beta fold hydrolase n=1 Tax=uncultured Jatrophihabitans sp. TaxID=1610747 RepID=UPI0035C9A62C
MSAPHAAEHAEIELPQGRIRYRDVGPRNPEAPVVVLVHGFLVSGSLWTGVADRLAAAGVRSIAPDLPLGSHQLPLTEDADVSPRGIARLVLDLVAALELTDVTLVGNDTGGGLCQFVIDTDAQRIGRLVLTNCDCFDQFPPPPFGIAMRAGKHPALFRAGVRTARATVIRHSALAYGPLVRDRRALDPELTRSWVDPLVQDKAIAHDLAKFCAALDPAELLDISTRLADFGKPVTLVWGAADPFFKLALGCRLRDAFGNATLIEIADGKTFVPIDEPQRLSDAIVGAGHRLAR